ncbi:MAG: hypothetical protein ACUZ77_07855 [Candidatus Brocadiales bacterium]
MEALLPYLPQLITFAIRLGTGVVEMLKTMSAEEIQEYLDKAYDDIAVKKRLRRNADGKLEWN